MNSPAASSLPTDPVQFLEIAAKVNGLASDNILPWHVKASFQIFGDEGKVKESGTYEAFWKSPRKYKVSYSSPSYNRTIWANDSGNFSTANLKWPGNVEWMIRRSLFDLAPDPPESRKLQYFDMRWRQASAGIRVNCLDWVPKAGMLLLAGPQGVASYCFDEGTPILRYNAGALQFYQGTFSNIALIGGAYVARDVQLLHAGKPYFRLHVDTLEPLAEVGDELFRPDPGAVPVPRRIVIDSDLRQMHARSMAGIPRPSSPRWKTPQLLSQEVIVQVLVNKKGRVADARAVTGDQYLQFQGIKAADQWEFHPYLVHGEPTEFYTELEFF